MRGARKRQRFLQLGACQVGPEAVVDAGAEGQRLVAVAVGGDVERASGPSTSRLAVTAQTMTTVSTGNVTSR